MYKGDENNIKYNMSKDIKKEWNELAKKINYGMVNDVVVEIFNKLIDVDFDKIMGFELTKGQDLIVLMVASDRLSKCFNSMLIKNYGAIGKDNKKRRKELEKYMHSMFLLGLMDDMKD